MLRMFPRDPASPGLVPLSPLEELVVEGRMDCGDRLGEEEEDSGCLLQVLNHLAGLSPCERGPCTWVLRLSCLKPLPQKQGILETSLSSACLGAFNRKNGAVSHAKHTPFLMTRLERRLLSRSHMPGSSFI